MTTDQLKLALRRLADRIVRVHAAAALVSCGFAGAAISLSSLEEIDDERRFARAKRTLATVTIEVLSVPPDDDDDRALVALMAAHEALAMAAADPVEDAHVQELVVAAEVARAAGRPR